MLPCRVSSDTFNKDFLCARRYVSCLTSAAGDITAFTWSWGFPQKVRAGLDGNGRPELYYVSSGVRKGEVCVWKKAQSMAIAKSGGKWRGAAPIKSELERRVKSYRYLTGRVRVALWSV